MTPRPALDAPWLRSAAPAVRLHANFATLHEVYARLRNLANPPAWRGDSVYVKDPAGWAVYAEIVGVLDAADVRRAAARVKERRR